MGLGAFVLVEVALGLEGDATGSARVRPFPGVAAQVLLQHTGFQTVPATMRAQMLPCRLGSGCRHGCRWARSLMKL